MSGPTVIKDFPGRAVDAHLKAHGYLPGECRLLTDTIIKRELAYLLMHFSGDQSYLDEQHSKVKEIYSRLSLTTEDLMLSLDTLSTVKLQPALFAAVEGLRDGFLDLCD